MDGDGPDDGATAHLRLLATTDLHAHLLPYDDHADRPLPGTGLVQAARLIRRLRAEAPGGLAILLDNGDVFQGTLLADWLAGRGPDAPPPSGPHPMVAAMNALAYDAGTMGNHDFNHGLPFLLSTLGAAAFPMVSTNVRTAAGRPLLRPSVILDRIAKDEQGRTHSLRIGVLGVAPPQIERWDSLVLRGAVRVQDIVPAAAAEIARLRAQGADLVVALCHSGIGGPRPEPFQENAALPLAALPGLDALILGHTHRAFPGPGWAATEGMDPVAGTLHGRPAVQAGAFGGHVGVIDLALRREARAWRVAAHRVRAEPVPPDLPLDEELAALAVPYQRRLSEAATRPIGTTRVPLQSHFSLVASDATLDVLADALRHEARHMLAGTPAEVLPVLAAVAPFKAGGRSGPGHYIDIPPGPVALRQGAELYIHPNAFCVVEIKGAGLRDWLERSAAIFRTLTPGDTDQPLLDEEMPPYNFDVIDGLSWVIDPLGPPRTDRDGRVTDPAARRVRDLRHDGRPVTDGDRFALVTNSYRLGGGGGFAAAQAAHPLIQSTRGIRDIVQAHLRRAGPLDPAPRPRWRFAPHPGTAAWFDSGPGAARHLPAVADRRIEPLHPAPGGFHRFRLWL
ncbi:bifunctional 2',3'-cyclic-nucleotide 2'-phosphodiesterase/3'-nucleotidase [Rubellimicrobium roseum]|uniref:bifunctional 2',3'-cyclic-nucleotide 2'-phosphodiesterase/3'-nucleotidase n=1 Tax=Rubellimicrobium roseum TaxID=687525 RepID=UPI00159BAC7C|nr:bifunctional 2',3'-cyclic-nucleotide 2'-phosphodiesterase/3'-nucleotidase [Rubellimicrobium roseum]